MILNINSELTTEHNDNNNEGYSPMISDIASGKSDKGLLEVLKALESVGFSFIDYHEN